MTGRTSELLALSVHGSAGALDLVVPPDAGVAEVAAAYAEQAGLPRVPVLVRASGHPLLGARTLGEAGVGPGSVLVALLPGEAPRVEEPVGDGRARGRGGGPAAGGGAATGPRPGLVGPLLCTVAGAVAALAGWLAADAPGPAGEAARAGVVAVLAGGTLIGLVPGGLLARHRAVAAPAFGAAAALALLWDDPAPEQVPSVVGGVALVAAVVAAAARAVRPREEEALGTLAVAGAGVFAVTAAGTLLGAAPQVAWAVLLVVAVLAAQAVPTWAVHLPDHLLVDVDRLAVTAWTARNRSAGPRRTTVVHAGAVAEVAARGARTVTASAAAVLGVVAVVTPLLLATATAPVDRVGAPVLVGAAGATLLLAARSHRHRAARGFLRAAGLWCLGALLVHGHDRLEAGWGVVVAATAVAGGLASLLAAVATGRGWRSTRWSRRAELLEALCGSVTVASLVVATGLFRALWERTY